MKAPMYYPLEQFINNYTRQWQMGRWCAHNDDILQWNVNNTGLFVFVLWNKKSVTSFMNWKCVRYVEISIKSGQSKRKMNAVNFKAVPKLKAVKLKKAHLCDRCGQVWYRIRYVNFYGRLINRRLSYAWNNWTIERIVITL